MNFDTSPNKEMRLKKLEVARISYGANAGQYEGKICFESEGGEITLNMSPDHCARMFAVVAEGIVQTAKDCALTLTEEAMATIAKRADLSLAVK